MSDAIRIVVINDIVSERLRQISDEGWSIKHDDKHRNGELAAAAACYAMSALLSMKRWTGSRQFWRDLWPWDSGWWKPRDRRRDLVRAGALIVAEIERLDRASERARPPAPGKVD